MRLAAQPREIEGATYSDPVAYMVAGGFNAEESKAVINAYKAFYSKQLKDTSTWLAYVTANTAVTDEARAMAIIRRYRNFYGK